MPYYQIRFKGQLNPAWEEYFVPLCLKDTSDGATLLEGNLKDQASLFGILNQIYQLNLWLVSVNQIDGRNP
jgi:hypothetical protein